jgi:hypothetical protein
MFRKLVESARIEVEGQSYVAHFFELRTARGARRYSCEIVLPGPDRIILDDDSMSSLATKVDRLAPAVLYSRTLASGPLAAA